LLITVRPQARRDIRAIGIYFTREGRPSIPAKFRNAMEQSIQFLAASPGVEQAHSPIQHEFREPATL
jgi:hypothetical protein